MQPFYLLAGNRIGVTELSGRTVTYSYDDLYRLTNEAIANDPHGVNGTVSYGYDPVGNRLSRTSSVAGVPSQTSTYDANDRLSSDSYDANGNTTASNGNNYAYDFENRLTSLNSGTATYLYDGDGNRVAKTAGGVTTNYLVDTNNHTGYAQVVEELQSGAVVKQFTYGHDLISQRCVAPSVNCTLSFYGYDGHGSVRQLTDATAVVTDTYDYDAFGNLIHRTGTTPNDYRYSGEQFDSNLGFYYLRARYINPSSGRFWTQDNFEGTPFDPLSLHKYAYANSNPANLVDPSGNFSLGETSVSLSIHSILSNIAVLSLRGAIAGAILGAGDAFFGGRDIFQSALDGAIFGALTGPFAGVKYIRAVLVGAGVGLSAVGSLQAWLDEEYDQALYRGILGLSAAVITWRLFAFSNVRTVDPATLRWTQRTAGGHGRADVLRSSLKKSGWQGPPIDVVETPNGLVTVDHTRAAVALETLEQKTLCERVKFLRGKFSVAAPALHGFRSFVEMKAQSLIPWRFSRDDL